VKILGGGADHGWSADVDVLDQFFERDTGLGGSFFEGVEIHHDHVDRLDAMLGHGGGVRGILAAVQNAAVHLGMQRLDAAVEHFRETGEFGDIFDGDAGVAQKLGCASGGNEFDAVAESWRAKSTRPVLSVTLRMARWIWEVLEDMIGLLGNRRSDRKFYQLSVVGRLSVDRSIPGPREQLRTTDEYRPP
jgi:hypothetical protein